MNMEGSSKPVKDESVTGNNFKVIFASCLAKERCFPISDGSETLHLSTKHYA
jgi:hypothetical protein